MPKFIEDTTFSVQEDLVIGAISTKGGEPVWYARIYIKTEKKAHYKSLKMPYLSKSSKERMEATKQAQKIYAAMVDRARKGIKTTSSIRVIAVIDEYLSFYKDRAERNQERINEGLQPVFIIAGTNAKANHRYYSLEKYKALFPVLGKANDNGNWGRVKEFFHSIGNPEITTIKEKDLNKYREWCATTYKMMAPSTIARDIVQIRMVWRYARDEKDYVNSLPTISSPPQDLALRSRKKLTEEVYKTMIEDCELHFNQMDKILEDRIAKGTANKKDYIRRDNALQFWMFMLIVSYSGYRPPKGKVEGNLVKWEHIDRSEEGQVWIHRPWEKQKTYDALLMPAAHHCIDRLQELQVERGCFDPANGYLFVHTFGRDGSYEAGAPFKSFRTQWDAMLDRIGLTNEVGAEQKDRLTIYSLRGAFITFRMRYGGLTTFDLAKICGTSERMVVQAYADFVGAKEHKRLTMNDRGLIAAAIK